MKGRFLWKKNPPDEGSSAVAPSLPRGVIITSSPCTWSKLSFAQTLHLVQVALHFIICTNSLHLVHVALHWIICTNSFHIFVTFYHVQKFLAPDSCGVIICTNLAPPCGVSFYHISQIHRQNMPGSVTKAQPTEMVLLDFKSKYILYLFKEFRFRDVLPGGCIVQGWCSAVGAPGNWHPCISVQVFFVVKPSNLLRL